MKCIMCKGELENRTVNFISDLGHCIIIVKNVPAQVCSQCGEVSYNNEIAEQLEKIVNSMRSTLTEIMVLDYSKVA